MNKKIRASLNSMKKLSTIMGFYTSIQIHVVLYNFSLSYIKKSFNY
jgi:hypothetical protein